ncbi:MAG: 2-oxo acid dehydrogenase subunit E2 [Planctomycetaceae bacterium]
MTIEFKLPEVAEGVESVDIAEILVSEGETIKAGAVICEVETEKAVAEIECPHAGVVSRILVSAGDSVAVGSPLVVIEESAGSSRGEGSPRPDQTADHATRGQSATASTAVSGPTASTATGESRVVEFRLPPVSEGIESIDIAQVLVSVGETIQANAVVCEVETDKAVAEINCPYTGTVREVHVSAGDTISVGSPLISVATFDAETNRPASARSGSGGTAPSPKPASADAEPKAVVRPAGVGGSEGDKRPPAPAGPATRRLARKLGVDLYQVRGSADGGRITIEDLEAHVKERLSKSSADPVAQPASVPPLPDFSRFGPIEKESLNRIARVAAANLHGAWITIPHVTQHDLADITELEAARKRYVKSNPRSPKVTMTAVMIKAVVGALKAFPKVNSSIDLDNGELIIKHYFHIGVAVDTPGGLVVPVIRNCDQKNVLQVAEELTDLATRARDRKLKTEEMQGASFTITNLGGIGGTSFTPIVNYPEVAILGMSRGQKHLALEDGQVTEKLMLPLSLSYDHRAINGADAARFIVKLSGSLTNFFELF